ncbi:sulfite exporter TauE/SafE family protein [Desulfosporosinus sp. PR]|uniref:sulfite exporter TauE/SafE family protein n=1 Tax=Candidatus Desulfosporosinus nitrosoreducens TaxID=3401928 RepID=UPI0027F68F9B|nr:sulfite exporter TauE/SafE family protein [Desulfosporosinus sp. PR]MDQ7096599.1 sulfite exporter TauE/SafE family protein [Desulfosporosinus sp. PR]
MLNFSNYIIIALASLAAGAVNSIAGGGTLITFPVLTALGIPAVSANITNTVALCPGYLGGSLSQGKDLQNQKKRLWLYIPASIVGGLLGGILLRITPEGLFRELVPYLILLATALLVFQPIVRSYLTKRTETVGAQPRSDLWGVVPVGIAAIYGGYFGAGLSIIVLAVLGITVDDSLTQLNALKQTIALGTNLTAGLFFVFSGKVVWSVALVMAIGALLGGALGGKLAGHVKPAVLRWMVVVIGLIVATLYFIR